MIAFLLVYFVVWLVCLMAAPYIADERGHSAAYWFLIAVVFGPFAVIAAALLKRPDASPPA